MYQLTTLPSSLRVASESLPGVESAAITVSVDVGARYESEAENGLSHVLEHMAFKGTKTRSAKDIAEAFDTIGGQFNAYTSMEHTVYYAKVLKEHLALAAEILGDILRNSVFDEAELARERSVVIQEIGMHHDTPEDYIFDLVDKTAYPAQAMGRTILGTAGRVAGFTRENVMGYMARHYIPGRMVVSAAGNLAHEEVLKLAGEHFAFADLGAPATPEPGKYQGGEIREQRDLEQLHLVLSLPCPNIHDPDFYALQLYTGILGGGMSSRLFQEVREKRGLAYTIYASASAYRDCGLLNIYSATAPQQAGELRGVLNEQLEAMTKNVSQAELIRAKNQSKAELLMAKENPATVANWIGRHLLVHGEYRDVETITRKIQAVTLEDVMRVARRNLEQKPTLAMLGT